jgi:hypothetical protein
MPDENAGKHGTMCMWCGEVYEHLYTPEEAANPELLGRILDWAQAHDMSCPKNPLASRVRELERELAARTPKPPDRVVFFGRDHAGWRNADHLCGLSGYCPGPPHFDPECPACAQARADREQGRT